MESGVVWRRPPRLVKCVYAILAACKLVARACSSNCGLWRDFGIVRMSTSVVMLWALSVEINVSMCRVEWPIVWMVSDIFL
jgi:hypothetical protein